MYAALNSTLKLLIQSIVISTISYFLALELRFDFEVAEHVPSYSIIMGLCILLFCRLLSYIYLDAQSIYWRYFALKDFEKLFKCHLASTILFTALILLFRLPEFPRSIIFIEFLTSFAGVCAAALAARLHYESSLSPKGAQTSSAKSVIVGAGDSGQILIKSILSGRIRLATPVHILDDDVRTHGTRIHGIKVEGSIERLRDLLIRDPDLKEIYVASLEIDRNTMNDITTLSKQLGRSIREFDSFEDIFLKTFTAEYSPQPLHRSALLDHSESHKNVYRGKSVLVTGAGGSIGSEIVRQLLSLAPQKIILLDNSEFNIFKLENEILKGASRDNIDIHLADIRDADRIQSLFSHYNIDMVIHAAAYKHVPYCETNPTEAFKTNVIGTLNVLTAAMQKNVDKFTLISSDKAVEPSNIMGCTKRIAEALTRLEIQKAQDTRAAIVRFGNVVNSAGSVIPLFRDQIMKGGPVTVTHPDVKRYFMSTYEAVQLTLMTGSFSNRDDILIFDMGKEVLLKELAEEMIAFYNRDNIQIQYIGLRPGEKLSEKLADSNEELGDTEFDKIKRVISSRFPSEELRKHINNITDAIDSSSEDSLRKEIFSLLALC